MGKGDNFERDMCLYLSLWLTNGERNDVLWRNRLRRTVMSPDGKHQLGDVTATDPIGYPFINTFNIELKTGYSKTKAGKRTKNIPWDLLDVIDYTAKESGSFIILDFWKQTKMDAEMSKRIPMLIFSRDYHVPVVCMPSEDIEKLEDYCGSWERGKSLSLSFSVEEKGEIDWEILVFLRADDFFKWFRPEIIELVLKDRAK